MRSLLRVVIGYVIGNTLITIFVALGISFLSFQAIDTFVTSGLNAAASYYSSLPADVIAILSIASVPEGLSILGSGMLTASLIHSARLFLANS